MKRMTTREIMRWAAEWFARERPNEVRPFFISALLEDFQAALMETTAGDGDRERPDLADTPGTPQCR